MDFLVALRALEPVHDKRGSLSLSSRPLRSAFLVTDIHFGINFAFDMSLLGVILKRFIFSRDYHPVKDQMNSYAYYLHLL